jgi:hypothetical protein
MFIPVKVDVFSLTVVVLVDIYKQPDVANTGGVGM